MKSRTQDGTDREAFIDVLSFLLVDEKNWEALSTYMSKSQLFGLSHMADVLAIELDILANYLRRRAVKDTKHEQALAWAKLEMRRELGAGR